MDESLRRARYYCDRAIHNAPGNATLPRSVLVNNTRVVIIMCEIRAIVVGYCLFGHA